MAGKVGPLVVVIGETASGKSALALELARKFEGEIICADSLTVYRDFNIGTAKPTSQERAEVPHHLLDIADPRRGFSAAVFKELATPIIEKINSLGKLPILVGGTGLYVDSVVYNYSFLEAPSKEKRRELDSLSLYELLNMAKSKGLLDLETSTIDVRNKRRVIRLIENDGKMPDRQPLRPNTLLIGMALPRQVLKERIEKRVDTMLRAGLEFEVETLANKYGWNVEPMKSISYREWFEYFNGSQSLEQTRQKIINDTLQLAKKQRTWFGRNKSIQWVENQRQAVDLTTTLLNKNGASL